MRNSWSVMALCMTAVCIGIPLTANGALLFHLSSGSAMLFSALFFAGFGCGTMIGGRLADRVPPARVLLASCTGVTIASIALPLWPQVGWILFYRSMLGFWAGSVFVAGARLASLQPRALLTQGVYGGCLQLGAGLGVLLSPVLLSWLQVQGTLLFWALGSFVPIGCWFLLATQGSVAISSQSTPAASGLLAALRLPAVWRLGAIHAGTFGLGTAIASWIALSIGARYHLPLTTAATLGSLYVLVGIVLRPAGGMLAQGSERWMVSLIRGAVALTVLGVLLLAFASTLALGLCGTLLLAVGMNTPYASVLTLAARAGQKHGMGAGVAQGVVVMLLCLGLMLMTLLIGLSTIQPFAASGMLFGGLALLAAWMLPRIPSRQRFSTSAAWIPSAFGGSYERSSGHSALESGDIAVIHPGEDDHA